MAINGKVGACVALAGVLVAAVSASGQSIGVFVGYADTARPNPVDFPSPWFGSPFVVFEGCAPPSICSYDAGAVMVTNNTLSPVTVNSVEVDIDTCVFNMWPSASVPAGGSLIVTQTISGSDNGCTTNGHMDTSDIGPGGSPYSGNCTPDGIIPVVKVTIDGTTSTFSDTGQVLNTGGFDLASCPSGTNESSQWTAVGSAPCGGAIATLAPATQTLPVGSAATLQVTLTNCSGVPLANVQVDFVVVPFGPYLGTAVTDSNGVALLTYSSSVARTDTVVASVTNAVGSFLSNFVTVKWQTSPCVGVVCTPLDQCHVATCDPSTAMCSNQPAPDNTLCTNNACTQTAICQSGVCVCTPPELAYCPALPAMGCDGAAKSQVLLESGVVPKLDWKWGKGIPALSQSDFGDPVSGGTNYLLCVYDESGGSPVLKMGATIFGGGTCPTKACWKASGTSGWSYKNRTGNNTGGVTKVKLKGGAAGKPLIKLAGGGSSLVLPAPVSGTQFFNQDTALIVQLSRTDAATCWISTFSTAGTKRNTGTEFKAKTP